MPLKKELFQYVKLDDSDIVTYDLRKTSSDLDGAMQSIATMLELQREKYELIDDATAQTKEFLSEIKQVNEVLLRGIFSECIGKCEAEMPLPKIELKTHKLKKLGSQEALRHLKRNLAELKSELGVE